MGGWGELWIGIRMKLRYKIIIRFFKYFLLCCDCHCHATCLHGTCYRLKKKKKKKIGEREKKKINSFLLFWFPEYEEQYVVEMAENSDDDNSDDDNDDDDDKECSDSEGRTEGADAGVTDSPPASTAAEQEAKETGVETLPVHFHPGRGRDEWV